jgi:A/G-specific adenine glycosylase
MRANGITGPLLDWYDDHARALPWRVPPGSRQLPDPYRVWLAEIMLQQTTVVTVAPYFERFLARWPTVDALAAAEEAEVMREWAGLGYYARARNLLAAARAAALAGFPRTEAGLRALPGVGPYTAAAIAAIAFGARATVIDGNIERVVTRLFAIATPLPGAKAAISAVLEPLVPADRPGDFAQALMDLGATICTPRNPRCLLCPLSPACAARAEGKAEAYPVKPVKRARPLKTGLAWWIERGGAVALIRRPPRGLLGGMPALPGTGWSVNEPHRFPFAADWQLHPEPVVHGFTHFELRLTLASARIDGPLDEIEGAAIEWTLCGQLADAGLPTLYARAVRALAPPMEMA